MKRSSCIVTVLFLAIALGLRAQSVVWSVSPQYEEIKPYSAALYLYKDNGHWGLMNAAGNRILTADNDFITGDGTSIGLFGVNDNGRYQLRGIVRPNGTIKSVTGRYYLTEYSTFSEGKLPIADASGKQGFINENGDIVVKCKFEKVRPFKEGLASVKKGNYVFYITDRYDTDKHAIYSEFKTGHITFGSSFKNGEAVVGYGGEYAVINKSGRQLRRYESGGWQINAADYTIDTGSGGSTQALQSGYTPRYTSRVSLFTENGLYGLRQDGATILGAVLGSATQIDANEICIAQYNGNYGLLRLTDEELSVSLTTLNGAETSRLIVQNGRAAQLRYEISAPQAYQGHTSLLVDNGSGSFEDVSSNIVSGSSKGTYTFQPVVGRTQTTVKMRCRLLYDGIEVFNATKTLSIERPLMLTLSAPIVMSATADIQTDIQNVAATVRNDSDEETSISVTLSVACSKNESVSNRQSLTIPAKSSRQIVVGVKVNYEEDARATVRLNSDGTSKTSTVKLRQY